MRIRKILIILMSFIALFVAIITFKIIYLFFPFSDSIVVNGTASDGTEVYVVQSFNGFGEPYKVSLFSRYPGAHWRRMYLEHEDSRWREASLEFRHNQVSVFRQGEFHSSFILPGSESLEISPGERDSANGYYYPGSWSVEEILLEHSKQYVEQRRNREY